MSNTDDLIARAEAALEDVTEDQTSKIISDADVIRVHGHANFGSMMPREVIADGVLKYAYGYQSGYTQLMILLEHGLIRKPKPGSYRSTLTKRGQAYFRAAWPYKQTAAARQLVPDLLARVAAQDTEIERLRAERPGLWMRWRDDMADEVSSAADEISAIIEQQGVKIVQASLVLDFLSEVVAGIRTLAPPDTEGS